MQPHFDNQSPLEDTSDSPVTPGVNQPPAEPVESGLRALSQATPPSQAEPDYANWRAEAERQDRRAAIYDDLYETLQPCFRAYEDWIAEAVYSAWYEGRGRVLVVGCGTGTLLQRLIQRMPARLITAIDLSSQMARRAREKVPAVFDIRTVPFDCFRPVVPFDVVAFNGSLAGMTDLRAIANHTAGITLHGSRVVICVRNGGWQWQDPAVCGQAHRAYPSWYWHRWINGKRVSEIAAMTAPVVSPYPLLSADRIGQAFDGRFGQRDSRTDFGVTRLFEDVISVPREQSLQTVGLTRERRPWMRKVERLREMDAAFAKQHPMGGGLLAMLFDKLH